MAVSCLGLQPSEVRQMTIGEINAVFNARIKQNKGSSLGESDYDELLEKFREAKRNERN